MIDNKGQFRYDALNFFSDGFSNNQFVGSWTSYKTNITKRCNWGDYRIPESGDLDIGVGEFSVKDKYLKTVGKLISLLREILPKLQKRNKLNKRKKNNGGSKS
ncbi:hypothetical protein [Riemerella anatipestifer]|uniref:hypothetical protein n=1 Tax=Riemerella anatipestifer TaxID=34085 RepID=UPI0021A9E735|nr:hypothetical protein [Riemerella anatipestifer]